MRLIDKDTLIEVLGVMQGLCDTKAALIQNSKIWQQVKDLPTVDAVPVIRCKDCKYCSVDRYADGNVPDYVCIEMDCGVEANGFCAWAERKEE